jgi:hypothetical protein
MMDLVIIVKVEIDLVAYSIAIIIEVGNNLAIAHKLEAILVATIIRVVAIKSLPFY